VEASAVVEHFNNIENSLASLGSSFEVATIDVFICESASKGLHGSVVVAVAFAAHGGVSCAFCRGLAIVVTGVLNTAVGMKHQAGGWLALSQGHAPSGQDKFGVDVFTHGPACQVSAVKVQNAGQVQPALVGGYIANVPKPDLVGGARRGQERQAIEGNGLVVVAVGGADSEPNFGASTEALLAH